jgi:hypothetical protein
MKGIKFLIAASAIAAVGAGTAGIVMNTKKSKMKRLAKKTGKVMYTVGTVLRTISCPEQVE